MIVIRHFEGSCSTRYPLSERFKRKCRVFGFFQACPKAQEISFITGRNSIEGSYRKVASLTHAVLILDAFEILPARAVLLPRPPSLSPPSSDSRPPHLVPSTWHRPRIGIMEFWVVGNPTTSVSLCLASRRPVAVMRPAPIRRVRTQWQSKIESRRCPEKSKSSR